MSVFRMEIDMSFKTEADMKAMLNFIEKKRDQLDKLDGPLPIPCKVRIHECRHDEGAPCSGYQEIEFDGVTDHGEPAENAVPESVKVIIQAPIVAEKEVLEAEKAALVIEVADLKKPAAPAEPVIE